MVYFLFSVFMMFVNFFFSGLSLGILYLLETSWGIPSNSWSVLSIPFFFLIFNFLSVLLSGFGWFTHMKGMLLSFFGKKEVAFFFSLWFSLSLWVFILWLKPLLVVVVFKLLGGCFLFINPYGSEFFSGIGEEAAPSVSSHICYSRLPPVNGDFKPGENAAPWMENAGLGGEKSLRCPTHQEWSAWNSALEGSKLQNRLVGEIYSNWSFSWLPSGWGFCSSVWAHTASIFNEILTDLSGFFSPYLSLFYTPSSPLGPSPEEEWRSPDPAICPPISILAPTTFVIPADFAWDLFGICPPLKALKQPSLSFTEECLTHYHKTFLYAERHQPDSYLLTLATFKSFSNFVGFGPNGEYIFQGNLLCGVPFYFHTPPEFRSMSSMEQLYTLGRMYQIAEATQEGLGAVLFFKYFMLPHDRVGDITY